MISMAVHIVFVWILGMTLQSRTVPEIAPKPEIRQEQKAPEPAPVEIEPEVKPPVIAPL